MLLEFTQEDFTKIDNIIAGVPFKYAYPIFSFLQEKVKEARQEEIKSKIKIEEDGNQNNG